MTSVREVRCQRDENDLYYARRPVICTVLALDFNGRWEKHQSIPKVCETTNRFCVHFDRFPALHEAGHNLGTGAEEDALRL